MRRRGLPLALCLLAVPEIARAVPVTVTVTDVRQSRGHLRIGICPRERFLDEVCPYHAIVLAVPPTVSVILPDVPPGAYAITVYQDEDDSGRLKRSFLGIPREPIGFSRNPPMHMGPPRFDDAAILIGDQPMQVSVTLRYR